MRLKIKFECDKPLQKGIRWLSKNGYFPLRCDFGERLSVDLYCFGDKRNEVKIICKAIGMKVFDKGAVVRVFSEAKDKLPLFYHFIDKLKSDDYKPKVRTMGISNYCYSPVEKKVYSIQFYDYDYPNGENITPLIISQIMEIFPYDCILYGTKHGLQFISFALLKGLKITKTRVLELSKTLGDQDFWTEGKDLTLRVSPKWDTKKGTYDKTSNKPVFRAMLKTPNQYRISEKHLEFYHQFMGLPDWVYYRYSDCKKFDYNIKMYHYKTRD